MVCGIYRTFLDTNIVWFMEWLGALIFDGDDEVLHSLAFQRASSSQQRQWLTLVELVRWAQHVNPTFLITATVVNELPEDRRAYGRELYEWSIQNDYYDHEVPANEADDGLLAILPNHEMTAFLRGLDRRLLAEAVFVGCDFFLTMDMRTIWRHRRLISDRLGISVLRPSDMLQRHS